MYRTGMAVFQTNGFNDGVVSYLFCTNKDEDNYDEFQISNLQNKDWFIAKITAVNSAQTKKRETGQQPT